MPDKSNTDHPYREPVDAGSMKVEDFLHEMKSGAALKIEEAKKQLLALEEAVQKQRQSPEWFPGLFHIDCRFIHLREINRETRDRVQQIVDTLDLEISNNESIDGIRRLIVHHEVFSVLLTGEKVAELTKLCTTPDKSVYKNFIAAAWLNSLVTPSPPASPSTPKDPG